MLHEQKHTYASRARRKSREILLALFLTLAAAAFALTALQSQSPETAAVAVNPKSSTPVSN